GRRPRRGTEQQTLVSDVTWWERVSNVFARNGKPTKDSPEPGPGFFDVLNRSIDIMQDRITRSRMAGDPPDIMIAPRLEHFELLDYARGAEAIKEGRAAVRRMLPLIEDMIGKGEELAVEAGDPEPAS